MTQPPLPPHSPSWLPPIFFGAILTIALWLLPDLQAQLMPGMFPFTHCCCCLYALPLGIVPAAIAARRDPGLAPFGGFAVSFIGVGLGGLLVAMRGVLALRETGRAEIEGRVREVLEGFNERVPPDQQLAGEQLEQTVAFWATVVPYVPVLLATVLTVFAGLLGLATVSVLRSRRARAQA